MAKLVKFEDKMNRLNMIVESLSNDQTQIDDAIKLYEEGIQLSDELSKQLEGYKEKLKEVKK